jgi:hypothetical protein
MIPIRFSPVWVWLAAGFALLANLFIFGLPSMHRSEQPLWPSQSELDRGTDFQYYDPVVCLGPRGKLLDESINDQIQPRRLPNRKWFSCAHLLA